MGGQSDEVFMLLAGCQDFRVLPLLYYSSHISFFCPMSVLSAVDCFLYRLGANGGSVVLKHQPLLEDRCKGN
jgi:hypothetical protein